MPNAQNKEMLASIKEDLDGVSAMWVVDYRGLTVKEMQQLRRDIRETGSVMKVYKNTLVHLALAEAELPTLDDMLAGPSAFVFSGNDVAASAKALKTFQAAEQGRGTAPRNQRRTEPAQSDRPHAQPQRRK